MIGNGPARWIALSDRGGRTNPSHELLQRGRLVFELALPLTQETTLLDRKTAAFALNLSGSAAKGIILRIERGEASLSLRLSQPRLSGLGLAQIHYAWDMPANCWTLSYLSAAQDDEIVQRGHGPLPFSLADLSNLSTPGPSSARAAALLWYGATPGDQPSVAPWIGPRTLIDTPKGLVVANDLRAGDVVSAPGGNPQRIRAIHRQVLPGTGSFAAIRLRAPYFGLIQDILVSPSQQVALSGVEVEYLFGADEVLIEARHLVDGARALVERRGNALQWIALDLCCTSAILTGHCVLAVAPANSSGPMQSTAAPTLDRFEARTLLAMLKRGAIRSAA
jgi:hypothetical protein